MGSDGVDRHRRGERPRTSTCSPSGSMGAQVQPLACRGQIGVQGGT
eukprot:CAMPEP_0184996786 /NCGR_PEP_ID=MMETSP1098-20130426/57632_1 /TAXON_ID=89044 /ORGANISM="Spumella elongata, Strain CCAP 955/1" /LENGTH=45 /DNA_ID= /DNA_START= /DNA_END= /DNA_ORIENTATION=